MPEENKLTPAMRQFLEMKKELSDDTILFFRMGDFYELFFDDAEQGASLMDVVLTQRNGVAMCGVPYHAAQTYIARLVEKGLKVAIAEQMEDPSQAKGLVKREITQVVTPGTVTSDEVLSASESNFLVAVAPTRREHYGLALIDVSTGDFRTTELAGTGSLETELHRLQPAECLLPQGVYHEWEENDQFPDAPSEMIWTPGEDWIFDNDIAEETLLNHFGVASLEGFGCRGMPQAVQAAGAIFQYSRNSLRTDAAHITSLRVYHPESYMVLDRISQRNLELLESLFTEGSNATLFNVLNTTVTPMGTRLLREWILRPLRDVTVIRQRQEVIQAFTEDPLLLTELREALHNVRDLERTITRVNLGSANARDLLLLRNGLASVPGLRHLLESLETEITEDLRSKLVDLPDIQEHISNAIVDDPPQTVQEGGIIRSGYSEELDQLQKGASEGKSWIASLQTDEQERTGIKSLKVRYNKVFGYYIEVTKPNLHLVPDDYIRKQTLVNAERFITPQLKEVEDNVLGAEEKSKSLEYELFQNLRNEVVEQTGRIQSIAQAVAMLDVLASLAETASRNRYCRPRVSNDSTLVIKNGRHPVLDHLMTEDEFVPNDTELDTEENQLAVITGPNMAGKSTYIRQVALLVVMAQMGSFVPADEADVGVADRIFTRVGAADDIARGQSTFMVEMVETANILHNATSSSLVILDEIGRGTSTFDGLSLAWAVAEYLHDTENVRPRTLFATHYHELTELAKTRERVRNYNIAVKEYGEQIIFLRKILPGAADQSYGVHVARLAGLPKPVIERAREVLSNLEGNALTPTGTPRLARRKKRQRSEVAEQQHPSLFDAGDT